MRERLLKAVLFLTLLVVSAGKKLCEFKVTIYFGKYSCCQVDFSTFSTLFDSCLKPSGFFFLVFRWVLFCSDFSLKILNSVCSHINRLSHSLIKK